MGILFGPLETGRHQSHGKWLHNVEIVFLNANLGWQKFDETRCQGKQFHNRDIVFLNPEPSDTASSSSNDLICRKLMH